jgi:hypothetical protein
MADNQTIIDRSRRNHQAETHRQTVHLPGQTNGHPGGGEYVLAKIVVSLSYGEPDGIDTYRVRLATDATATWASGTVYTLGQPAIGSDGLKYNSVYNGNNQGHDPVGDNGTYWVIDNEIQITNFYSKKSMTVDLRDYSPWYAVSQIVRIVANPDTPGTYLLWDELTALGTPEESSMRWDEQNKHLESVIV